MTNPTSHPPVSSLRYWFTSNHLLQNFFTDSRASACGRPAGQIAEMHESMLVLSCPHTQSAFSPLQLVIAHS